MIGVNIGLGSDCDGGGGGAISEITGTAPIVVTGGTGPIANISINAGALLSLLIITTDGGIVYDLAGELTLKAVP